MYAIIASHFTLRYQRYRLVPWIHRHVVMLHGIQSSAHAEPCTQSLFLYDPTHTAHALMFVVRIAIQSSTVHANFIIFLSTFWLERHQFGQI